MIKVGDWVQFKESWEGIVENIKYGEDMNSFVGKIGEVLLILEGVPWVALGVSRTLYPIPVRFLEKVKLAKARGLV